VAPLASIIGLGRLVHLFPSLLTSSATVAIATLAGAAPPTAVRLGVAMFGFQISIGALNDVVDAPLDARQKPRKPIPSGLIAPRAAVVVAVIGGLAGTMLSGLSGWPTAAVGLACLGLGYLYDLRLSRTTLSWLPLSLALPLLPIHAWLGATGTIPIGLLTLVPVGVLAGGALALANGLVDIDRDTRSGRMAAAVALGRQRAWLLQTVALGVAVVLAVFGAPAVPADLPGVDLGTLRALRLAGVAAGVGLVTAGAAVLAAGRPNVRERGWELEAIGVLALGLGWLAGTAAMVAGGGAGP
jgi:4-hydroxybenzoate polyprenyltransferase